MFAPRYFGDFICTADKCTHNCCIGWEIDIDEDTLTYYKALPARIGKKILSTVQINAEGAHFMLGKDKRCKNLDRRGLCRIYKVLGHEGLCDICREHPRFYHTVDREEAGLGAACEAAAALILTSDAYADFVCFDGNDAHQPLSTEFDARKARETLYNLLRDRTRPLTERLTALEARYGRPEPLQLDRLEYLEPTHQTLFSHALGKSAEIPAAQEPIFERFFAYLIYRHASPTACATAFATAVRLSLALLNLFIQLVTKEALTPVAAAVAISEEIEYSPDNTALLLATI